MFLLLFFCVYAIFRRLFTRLLLIFTLFACLFLLHSFVFNKQSSSKQNSKHTTQSCRFFFCVPCHIGPCLPANNHSFCDGHHFIVISAWSAQQISTNPFVYICTKYYEVNWIPIIIPFKQYVFISSSHSIHLFARSLILAFFCPLHQCLFAIFYSDSRHPHHSDAAYVFSLFQFSYRILVFSLLF